jgi:hypothetical protein
MTELSSLVDSLDLSGVHTLLAIYGGLLAIYVMQKTRYEAEDQCDPKYVRMVRTVALAAMSGAFFWSLTYRDSHDWVPAAPFLLMMAALDALLTVRVLAIWGRIKRNGPYLNAPSVAARSKAASNR